MKRFLLGIICFGLCLNIFAQNIRAELVLKTDSIWLGKPFWAELKITHDKTLTLLFPKQKEDFQPFELIKSEIEPSKEKGSKIEEIARFLLVSFSIDSIQKIKLEYAYLKGDDTVKVATNTDSALFIPQVTDVQADTPFHVDDELVKLKNPTNWALLVITIIVVLTLIVVLILMLRRPVTAYFQRRSMLREWGQLQRKFQTLHQSIENQTLVLDELNKMWKDSMDKEGAFQVLLRSLTTTELIPLIENAEHLSVDTKTLLIETAQAGDKVIYAGRSISKEQLSSQITGIQQILEGQFHKKMQK